MLEYITYTIGHILLPQRKINSPCNKMCPKLKNPSTLRHIRLQNKSNMVK